MKRSIAILVLALARGVMAFDGGNTKSNQVLVASVVQSVGEKKINIFPGAGAILGELEGYKDFKTLHESGEVTWRQSISILETNGIDRASRLVLLHSFLYLPPKEYMGCLERVLDLFQKGIIPSDEFLYIFLFSPRDENQWFLSYNADRPRMVKFLDRVRVAFEKDADVKRFVDSILKGKARKRDELLRDQMGNSSKRPVPRLSDD